MKNSSNGFIFNCHSFFYNVFNFRHRWLNYKINKNLSRWGVEFPIALAIAAIQIIIVLLLVFKFKVFNTEALTFLIPISLAINSFLVSSGQRPEDWYIRVLPAVGLVFLAIPIILINKAVAKSQEKQRKIKLLEEEQKINHCLTKLNFEFSFYI